MRKNKENKSITNCFWDYTLGAKNRNQFLFLSFAQYLHRGTIAFWHYFCRAYHHTKKKQDLILHLDIFISLFKVNKIISCTTINGKFYSTNRVSRRLHFSKFSMFNLASNDKKKLLPSIEKVFSIFLVSLLCTYFRNEMIRWVIKHDWIWLNNPLV